MFRYLKYFDYYLELFAKQLSGRGLMDPNNNGEYAVLENIIINKKNSLCFIDGGSNVGGHVIKFDLLCKKYKVTKRSIFAVEAFPPTAKVLSRNLVNIPHELINKALGNEIGVIKFYSAEKDGTSGVNSAIKHYYLKKSIDVEQTTIDQIFNSYNLDKVDFLKLDIEGFEYKALLGSKKILSKGLIDYIQLEYNQTWIEGGGTIKKILDLANVYSYKLYRIRRKSLLAITSYNFNLDDFFYCNLLLVKEGCKLPLTSKRKAIPII